MSRQKEREEDTLYGKVGLLPTENNDLTYDLTK